MALIWRRCSAKGKIGAETQKRGFRRAGENRGSKNILDIPRANPVARVAVFKAERKRGGGHAWAKIESAAERPHPRELVAE